MPSERRVRSKFHYQIIPRLLDTAAGRASGRSDQYVAANRLMDRIRAGITKHYQDIFEREGYVNAEKVRNAYLGLDCKLHTLLAVYGDFLNDFEKMYQSGSRSKSLWCMERAIRSIKVCSGIYVLLVC